MASIRLSLEARRILATIRLAANLPAIEVARLAKVKPHTVHYQLTKLSAAGVIKRWTLINQFALGFENFEISFSVVPKRGHSSDRLFEFLKNHPAVIWVGLLSGEFQYSVTLLAQNSHKVLEFLEELSAKGGISILRKSFATILSFSMLEKKYLWPGAQNLPRELEITQTKTTSELDDSDIKILNVINQCGSHTELAKLTGLPRTTVDLRIRKLEQNGSIAGQVYYISARALGRLTYRLLLHARGVSSTFYHKAHKFSLDHPCVVGFSKTLGPWDGVIIVEVESPLELTAIIEALNDTLSEEISDISVLQILRQHASTQLKMPSPSPGSR